MILVFFFPDEVRLVVPKLFSYSTHTFSISLLEPCNSCFLSTSARNMFLHKFDRSFCEHVLDSVGCCVDMRCPPKLSTTSHRDVARGPDADFDSFRLEAFERILSPLQMLPKIRTLLALNREMLLVRVAGLSLLVHVCLIDSFCLPT